MGDPRWTPLLRLRAGHVVGGVGSGDPHGHQPGAAGRCEPWAPERDRIHSRVMTKGWNEQLGAFVQYEGSEVLDASLVFMPLMGFVVPNDPRWQSTMAAMDKTLVEDSLVYRYDPKASPDGLPGS